MFLDSHLSAAFGRRPVSFLPIGCSLISNSSAPESSSFMDNVHCLNALKLDWQTTLSRGKQSNISADILHAALDNVDQAVERQTDDGSSSIQTRLNNLVYTIHACAFRASLIRYDDALQEDVRVSDMSSSTCERNL